nr:glycosyltransferase family 1 protein [Rhabdothermincola salaria]
MLGPRTGVGTFTAELLAALAARHDEPPLELTAFGLTWRGREDLRPLVPAGIDVVRRPMAARPLRELWQRIDLPPVEWWTGPVDVVHGPNFVVPPARRAAEVVTVHDLTCVRFPEMCTRDVLAYPGLLRRAMARGAWIHTVSTSVADEVAATFAIDPARVRTVPNGAPAPLDPDRLGPMAARGRHLAGSTDYVVALGTLEPRKDLPTLVRAFDVVAAEQPDIGLVIAGPDGWGADAVATAIAAARHRNRIRRLGWVTDADRDALLAGARVFAYPSLYEGFGLPPLEALAHRTPVLATRAGALPEVLVDAAEWAQPGDPDDLAAGLFRLLDDDDRCRALVHAGLARLDAFSWERTADGLVTLYRDAWHG